MVVTREKCQVCGKIADFQIADDAVLLREAKCSHCGASLRNSDVAGEIIRYISGKNIGLINQQENLEKYVILNACSSGYIHEALKQMDHYICSEFFDDVPTGEYNDGVLCVDLCDMPFEDNTIDIVITEDVFEHIVGYEKAMKEIYRVLKPGGCHIFTVPLHDGHKTVSRKNKKSVYHGDPIHADSGCLVITDWGDDIKSIVERYGYDVEVVRKHDFYRDDEITVVDDSYDEYLEKKDCLEKYLKYNSTVIMAYKKLVESPLIKQEAKYSVDELQERLKDKEQKIIALNRNIRDKKDIIKEINDDNELRGVHIIELDRQIQEKDMLIENLQKEEESRNQHIKELDAEIEEKGQMICELQKENEERNKHITHLDAVIEQNGEMIRGYQKELEEQKRINQDQSDLVMKQANRIVQHTEQLTKQSDDVSRYAELSIRKTKQLEFQARQIERLNEENCEQGKIIEKQKKIIQENVAKEEEYQKEIAELLQTVRNKEGHIELLLESERAYERDKNTHSYKMAKRMQKCADFLLPPDSKRRFLLRVLFNVFRHPILMLRVINPTRISNYFKYAKNGDIAGIKRGFQNAVSTEKMGMAGLQERPADVDVKPIQQGTENVIDISGYEKLHFNKYDNPTVSIIIPVYNEFSYTYRCLQSILEHSGNVTYEIIIADDCSTDATKRIHDIVDGINVITNNTNLRFLLNCNNAARSARGRYILFLNNDTQVQENWLQPLVDLIESDDSIGMVGSKLVYPDGLLQEAGGILWKDASAWNYGNRKSPDDSEFNYVKEVDYISGAAIMIKKSLWKEIGGFDEKFAPAYCEDSDLAFEVRAHGYKVMYQPLSVVVHFEGISNGTDTSNGQKAYQIKNQQKFYEKWKDVLEKEHFPNAENVFVARDRSKKKPVLLMVDHYVPQYDKDAGSRTVFQYLKMFVDKGYNVKFIGDNFFRHEPYTTTLQQMGIEVLYGPYYAQNWQDWIKENASQFNYVFLNRPHISVKYIDFIRENTNARIIYYGHDLHFLREMRKYELTHDKQALEDSEMWKEKEFDLMKKADVVYYPSNVEEEEIRKIDTSINVKAIVAYIFENVQELTYNFEQRKNIMFVGGFTHTPNVDAVLWFAKEIFPKIVEKIPDIKWYVMGSNPPQEVLELANDHIIIKGYVSDEELEQFYKQCRMSIVPLRYGAGIKGKVIEAIRYGIPVVTTSVGAEGINKAEDILCIADQSDELAGEIVSKYQDKEYLQQVSLKSYEYIRNNFSQQNAWNIVGDDFS